MAKKVIIELTEPQARIALIALEEWFRLRMGQYSDLANALALYDYRYDAEKKEEFNLRMVRRDAIQEMVKAMLRIAFPPYGTPEKVTPETHIASDIWSTLRYEMWSKDEWSSTPFQLGPEPLPKITVEEIGGGEETNEG